jgi:hypothetical protein
MIKKDTGTGESGSSIVKVSNDSSAYVVVDTGSATSDWIGW